jgi:uncharacterized membrane protein YoaK (UPF0700 family)
MSFFTGLLTGLIVSVVTWQLTSAAIGNLPSTGGRLIALALTIVAAVLGFLAGSALSRRAQRTREHLALFGSTAFAVAVGLVSAAAAVALLAAYLRAYGPEAGSGADMVLTVLAFPIFASLGFALGAVVGSLIGAILSGALRLLTPTPR